VNAPEQRSSSRTTRLAVVGIVLTILLGVVALVSRGHVSPAGNGAHDRGASQGLANAVFTLWIIAMIAGVLLLAYTLSVKKRDSKREEFRIRPLLFSLVFFAGVVISMVFIYNHLGKKAPPQRVNPAALGTKHLKKGDKKKLQQAANPHSPSFNWYMAAGIFAVIFAASLTALIASQRRRSKLVREITVAQELMAMLDETLDDLRNEADPRKAVIAAYARMEKILSAHGLARRPSEAPLEYMRRVLTELRITEEAVTKLTALFERAKFSEHEIGPEAKDEAIDALVELRDQLRVINDPREKPALLPEEVPGGAT
jgi:tetrahydromethanopterin S-methyltransferase subunit B